MTRETLIKTHTSTREHKEELTAMSHVRVMGANPDAFAIQIRSHGIATDHGKVERYFYSHATLYRDQALALRYAIDEACGEQFGEPTYTELADVLRRLVDRVGFDSKETDEARELLKRRSGAAPARLSEYEIKYEMWRRNPAHNHGNEYWSELSRSTITAPGITAAIEKAEAGCQSIADRNFRRIRAMVTPLETDEGGFMTDEHHPQQ